MAQTAPAPLQILPKPVARLLAAGVLHFDGGKLRDLLPGVRYDFNDVSSMQGKLESFAALDKPMLLLSGTKSAAYLRQSIRALKEVLPQAQHIEFEGLDHAGSWNTGRPVVVAAALREFFAN